MTRRKRFRILKLTLLAVLLFLNACAAPGSKSAAALPDDFILGMDISSVLSLEESGVTFRDSDGGPADLFTLLADHGVTHIRVRIWNDPHDAQGRTYGGGGCDLSCACEIGRRAAENGMQLIVDFHYSDFWADPGKQTPPKAWAELNPDEKVQALYRFTSDSLQALRASGASVAMVQLGNETNAFLCGERDWDSICALMNAGARAVREELPDALIAVHFTNPEREGSYEEYARQLERCGVDYDVFASSWYPFWHGSLDHLSEVLAAISELSGKRVMVMETSYPYTTEDSDFFANTAGSGTQSALSFPYTEQGQADAFRAVIDAVAGIPGGLGAVYWEGAWISAGGRSWEENRAAWDSHGCGWATRYAGDYDPDAGQYWGGSAVDNQAMFAPDGRPLAALDVFRDARGTKRKHR